MNLADLFVVIVLTIVVCLIVRSLRSSRSSCHGDCASCHSTCSKIDWNEVRKEIHDSKRQD